MAFDKTNTGTLGTNDRRTSEKHPTHSGAINVDGKEYWLSAWVKEGPRGKFFSLAIKPKEISAAPVKAPDQTTASYIDDDIPF